MGKIHIENGIISSSADYGLYRGTSQIANIQDGEFRVLGDLIAENYIVSSSVTALTFQQNSGSTIFGNSNDDTHSFTGSIDVSGSIASRGPSSHYAIEIQGDNTGGPQIHFGNNDATPNEFMVIGAFGSVNNINTQTRDFRIFDSGGFTGFYFDVSENKVGIGTTSPAGPTGVGFDVAGDGSTGAFLRTRFANSATTKRLDISSENSAHHIQYITNPLAFANATGTVMKLHQDSIVEFPIAPKISGSSTSTGSFGSLSLGESSHIHTLSIKGHSEGSTGIRVRHPSDDTLFEVKASEDDGRLRLFANNSRKIQLHANDVSYFNGGNVGIGIEDPDALLEVGPDANSRSIVKLTSTAAAKGAFIQFFGNDAESAVIGYEGGSEIVGSGVQGDFVIRNVLSGKDIILTTNSGNVGIDELGPDKKLHIKSSTSTDGIKIEQSGTGASMVTFHADSAERGFIGVDDSNGNAFLSSTSGLDYVMVIRSEQELHFGINGNNTRFILDNNSRISLSNNDSGGTGGSDSTSANTLLGFLAGDDLASGGVNNSFVGHAAGHKNTTGDSNSGFGRYAGFGNLTGDNNTFVGSQAGLSDNGSSHSNNTGVGFEALKVLTTGGSNTAVGVTAGDSITSANFNVAVGLDALGQTTTGGANVAVGYQAMEGDADGDGADNVAIGHKAMLANVSPSKNVAIGDSAMRAMNGTANGIAQCVAIGANAFFGDADNTTTNTDGTTAIGYNSLFSLTTGQQNTAIGSFNSDALTTGGFNTSVGRSTLGALTAGSHNVALGRATLTTAADDESDNIAIGNSALGSAKQDGTASSTNREVKQNIAIGTDALIGGTLTGARHLEGNVAIGYQALDATGANEQIGTVAIGTMALSTLTDGQFNVAIGYESQKFQSDGTGNTTLGYQSFRNADNGESFNVVIGHEAGEFQNHAASDGNVWIGGEACVGGTGNRDYSVAIGYRAWSNAGTQNNIGGSENIFIGAYSGNGTWATAASDQNTAVGYQTMAGNMNGAAYNSAFGFESLNDLTTGDYNTAIGYKSADALTTGTQNTALGSFSFSNSTEAGRVVAIGYAASNASLLANGEGSVAIGYAALNNHQQNVNTAVGYQSGKNCSTGGNNTALGYNTLGGNNSAGITGDNNTTIGHQAGRDMEGAVEGNVLVGKNAGLSITTAANNTLVGTKAGDALIDETHNVAVGTDALGGSSLVDQTVVVGSQAGMGAMTAAADGTVIVGYNAGASVTSGEGNTLIGYLAGPDITTGGANTIIGYQALTNAQTDVGNSTVIGYKAGQKLGDNGLSDHSEHNIIIGAGTMDGGHDTLANNTANLNIAIGNNALGGNTGTSTSLTAASNTVIGHDAMKVVSSGVDNVVVGKDAGDSITTGQFNTIIGKGADVSAASAENQIVIGRAAIGLGNNSAMIGATTISNVYLASGSCGASLHSGRIFSGAAGNGNDPILHVRDIADMFVAMFEGNRPGDTGAVVSIYHNPPTPQETNRTFLNFQMNDSGGARTTYGQISAFIDDHTHPTEDGNLRFSTVENGTVTEQMRIDSTGVGIGTTATKLLTLGQDAADGAQTAFIEIIDKDTDTTADTLLEILWSKYHTGTSDADVASIGGGIEQWSGTSSNRHTYMDFRTVRAGSRAEKMRITSEGKVGIGTGANVDELLHVQNDSNNAVIKIEAGSSSTGARLQLTSATNDTGDINFGDSGDTNIGRIKYDHTDNYLAIHTNDTEKMRIEAGGDILIKTADAKIKADSTNTLNIQAHQLKILGSGGEERFQLQSEGNSNPGVFMIKQSEETTTVQLNSDGVSYLNGGNVGIGTTNPTELLTLAHSAGDGDGGILIVNENTTIADNTFLGGIGFDSADGNIPSTVGEAGAAIVARSAEAHSTTDKGADLLFLTAPIDQDDDTTTPERMRIDSEGRVGIGTTSPGSRLHVEAADGESVNTHVASFKNLETTSGDSEGVLIQAGTSAADNALEINSQAGSGLFFVKGSGRVGIAEASPDGLLHVKGSTPDIIFEDTSGGSNSAILKFKKTSASEAAGDAIGEIDFRGLDDSDTERLYAYIVANSPDVRAGTPNGKLTFFVMNDGSIPKLLELEGTKISGSSAATMSAGTGSFGRLEGDGEHLTNTRSYLHYGHNAAITTATTTVMETIDGSQNGEGYMMPRAGKITALSVQADELATLGSEDSFDFRVFKNSSYIGNPYRVAVQESDNARASTVFTTPATFSPGDRLTVACVSTVDSGGEIDDIAVLLEILT